MFSCDSTIAFEQRLMLTWKSITATSSLYLPSFLSATGCYLLEQPPGQAPQANRYVGFLLGCSWLPLTWLVIVANWSLAWGKQGEKELKVNAKWGRMGRGKRLNRERTAQRASKGGEHLGLGLNPAWTSCHTCSIVCLASTSKESKGVAICSIMPFSSVLPWGFSCPAKCTAKGLTDRQQIQPTTPASLLGWLICWFFKLILSGYY